MAGGGGGEGGRGLGPSNTLTGLQDKMVICQKKKERREIEAGRRVRAGRGHAWGTERLQRGVEEPCSPCSALKGLFNLGGVARLLRGLGPETARRLWLRQSPVVPEARRE